MQLLLPKEKEIMDGFWKLGKPCLISDILKNNPELSRNTVAKALITLEMKGYLKVDSIRKTVTRTGRAYVPTVSKDIYESKLAIINQITDKQDLSPKALSFLSAFLQTEQVEDSLIDELDAMIQNYKNSTR